MEQQFSRPDSIAKARKRRTAIVFQQQISSSSDEKKTEEDEEQEEEHSPETRKGGSKPKNTSQNIKIKKKRIRVWEQQQHQSISTSLDEKEAKQEEEKQEEGNDKEEEEYSTVTNRRGGKKKTASRKIRRKKRRLKAGLQQQQPMSSSSDEEEKHEEENEKEQEEEMYLPELNREEKEKKLHKTSNRLKRKDEFQDRGFKETGAKKEKKNSKADIQRKPTECFQIELPEDKIPKKPELIYCKEEHILNSETVREAIEKMAKANGMDLKDLFNLVKTKGVIVFREKNGKPIAILTEEDFKERAGNTKTFDKPNINEPISTTYARETLQQTNLNYFNSMKTVSKKSGNKNDMKKEIDVEEALNYVYNKKYPTNYFIFDGVPEDCPRLFKTKQELHVDFIRKRRSNDGLNAIIKGEGKKMKLDENYEKHMQEVDEEFKKKEKGKKRNKKKPKDVENGQEEINEEVGDGTIVPGINMAQSKFNIHC